MSILHQSDAGYFLCHRTYSEEICGRPYKFSLFDIRTPFLKDQEATCEAQAMESGVARIRKRKRKREKKQLPLEESDVLAFISELTDFLKPPPSSSDFMANNKPAREIATQFLSSPTGVKIQDTNLELNFFNSSEQFIEKEFCNEIFILPPKSQFCKNDIDYLETLAKSGRNFSLVVMDPPWANRFVKRKRNAGGVSSYRSMGNNVLATLPVSRLCTDGTLVAVWCTNSKTHLDYLLNTLLPSWNLSYVATWFWIKVTVSGKFVCAWDGPSGKHPFERIILARKVGPANQKLENQLIPEKKLIVSVPCAIHSFKPPLQKLLRPFLQADGEALELFARSLLPNTVSLGNQVPLLQHISLFEDV